MGKKDLFQDMFLNSLYTLAGKNKPNILEETIKLKKELNAFYRNPKVPRYIKLLSKFDLPSLKDDGKTIDAIISLKTFPRDEAGNPIILPLKELLRFEAERAKKRIERQKEKEKRKKRSEEEIKK